VVRWYLSPGILCRVPPPKDSELRETDYHREPGYAERYRDRRFTTGSGGHTHEREARAIHELIARCSPARPARPWLDVPSGAGRLSPLLPGPVVLVDRDLSMVRAAPGEHRRVCASIHRLPFAEGSFSGALCMRLLHHIGSSEERRRILRELHRVTDGPVVVSFFHSLSVQHGRRVLGRLLGRRHTGRCAVTWRVFRRDIEAAGFTPVATRPLARFVSEQWLVLLAPKAGGVTS
jgi:SAM-dependent methyltransferase